MAKEKITWPKQLGGKLGFKVYRRTFFSALRREMGEAGLISRTIFTALGILVSIGLLWAGFDLLRTHHGILAAFCFLVVLGIVGYFLFGSLPGRIGSLKASMHEADKEAFAAQLKYEREHPDEYSD